jgi:hypothetical protein
MENKKKEEKEKEAKEEAEKEQQKEKKEEKKEEKKPRLNADQIDELLAERIERHEKRAEKAAKGKYDGKVMLNGMQPKYYYAAVRDFHKDMQEKIGRINDPKKREQYFAQYYNQKRMMAYVKHRATDPVYQRMVDKLKADKVLDTYEKARYARSPKGIKNMKPFGRGYGADGEVDRIHAIDTDRELFQNGKNEKKDWKDFKDAVQKYNEKIDALAKEGKYNGDEARQAAIEFNNVAHNYILENMGDKSQAEYVKEAKAMRQYTLDVFNESIAYANLRYDCRAVVEDAAKNKKTKLDYTDPLAAADLIIAKNMLSDNPNAKKFWESIPNDEQITPEYTKSAVKNFQKAREDVITNPFFNMTLLDKQGKSLNDFPADYNKLAAKQTEKIKQDQLKSAKQKEKELKKMLKQQEKLRKAEEKKMKKEGKKKEEVKQVIRPA